MGNALQWGDFTGSGRDRREKVNEAAAEIAFAMFLQGNMMHSLERMPGGPIGASKGDDTAAEIRYLAFTTPFWEFWNS